MVYDTNRELVAVENSDASEEPRVLCLVKDETRTDWKQSRITVNLPCSSLVEKLCSHVAKEFGYEEDSFLLVWLNATQSSGEEEVLLNGAEQKTLMQFGLAVDGARNNFLLKEKDGIAPKKVKESSDDIIADSVSHMFQESASSTSGSYTGSYYPGEGYSYGKSDTGFVGLVNQAMTCYLNSLLETLYMTPEFRNAIYRWEAHGSEEKDIKCIPSQLQKLFLQMQTSSKKAVETTDLTRSFGWDSSEAWQQHDVQELCRVMFDALESKFKGTEQEDLINKLYQGKVKDYVKCLECGQESARTDTYLDVPLTIRPFGENRAFHSVEESLEAFVAPETLDGSNQYFCEKCNKKCDAHKGLKFQTFPYLLTIQLKRFAFDYVTLHRIKLNDRMTFPKFLNLNRFASSDEDENSVDEELSLKGDSPDEELSLKGDSPSSTETDSGVSEGFSDNGVLTEDEESSISRPGGDYQSEAREAADAITQDCASLSDTKGPFVYELFSIMIHSGSASGGHYYAYIKSFADGQWYCFNDQSVTRVGDEEIERSFGGSEYGPRGYYSSLYSSSTNAYMLMYRQVMPNRNSKFLDIHAMPSHITTLMSRMQKHEETERRRREEDRCTCKIKVFFYNPVLKKILERKLEIHMEKSLTDAVQMTRELFGVELIYPMEQCRLVKYDEYYDSIEKSYDGHENTPMGELLGGVKSSYMYELLLETRHPQETFTTYKTGGTTIKVHNVILESGDVLSAFNVRAYLHETINDVKRQIQQKIGEPAEHMRLVTEVGQRELKILESPNKALKDMGFFKTAKMFVECSGSEDSKLLFADSQLYKVLDSYQHTIKLNVILPKPNTKPVDNQTSMYIFEEPKVTTSSRDKEIEIFIDKRNTLGDLKKKIEPLVDCASEYFRVYRVYCNNQEIEYTRLQDTLSCFMDETKVLIKYGRALKKGECQIKVSLLHRHDPEEPFKYLFDWVVHKGMTVRECKELLHPELQQRCQFGSPVENLRIRKKTWKNPGTVYIDSQQFDEDIAVYANFEVFVEELPGPERMTSTQLLSVYVRHWQPSTLTLGPLQEVVLIDATVDELKEEISKLSNIPRDAIDFAKGRGPFPSSAPVLEIHDGLDWNPNVETLGTNPLYICDDGAVIMYRDKTEPLLEISEEKKQEILKKENAKSGVTSKPTGYSYKERALKIYTDGTKPGS